MPRIRTLSNSRKGRGPPPGFEILEPTLDDFLIQMRDAERDPHDGKRKCESLWPILRLHHQRSRYVYEAFYKRKIVSRDVYDYCLREGWADANLIAKWKKQGYERLCCLRCIQAGGTNFGTTCICRVPKKDLEEGRVVECIHCGCRGCASSDARPEVVAEET